MRLAILAILLMLMLAVPHAADAWHAPSHDSATRAAVAAVAPDVPALAGGADIIAGVSGDPDLFTRPTGPTTLHAFMQAMGVVNDHIEGCHMRAACAAAARRGASP